MPDKIFEEFAEKLFTKYLEINPQQGTYLGLHEYDGKIGDITEEGFSKEITVYKELYNELNLIERSELTAINKYDHDIAKWAIEKELFELEELKFYKTNPELQTLEAVYYLGS